MKKKFINELLNKETNYPLIVKKFEVNYINYAKDISGIANTNKGYIIIGVNKEQNSTPLGFSKEFLIDDILNKAISKLSSPPEITYEYVIYKGVSILLIEVEKSKDKIFFEDKFYLNENNKTIKCEEVREMDMKKIFIVHGHDGEAKSEVARFIEKNDLEAIILHEQASRGQTIIEKIESNTNVGFAIVLYTPCDEGKSISDTELQYRARQNVVFEHGYLIGKLGRMKVCALVKGKVEKPNDISGVVYIDMDSRGAWKMELVKEMQEQGYDVKP